MIQRTLPTIEPLNQLLSLLLFEFYIFKSYKPAYSKANLGGQSLTEFLDLHVVYHKPFHSKHLKVIIPNLEFHLLTVPYPLADNFPTHYLLLGGVLKICKETFHVHVYQSSL